MKQCNDRKVCFIICTNHESFRRECLFYLEHLEVPEGYEIEVLMIEDAMSMASGYNEGMRASDAKYKVYLHQDTFIIDTLFISKMLSVFQSDADIGLIGMIGTEHLSKDGVMWHGKRCGDFYRLEECIDSPQGNVEQLEEGVREVEAVDGLLMATQYDIPWREDLLKGWDFYDVSQCLEFRRSGKKIVIPAQNPSWTLHATEAQKFWCYNEDRERILEEYPEIWNGKKEHRVLFVLSNEIQIWGVSEALSHMGHQVELLNQGVCIVGFNEKDVEVVEEALEEGNYDLVMTYDFCSSVSKACENMEVKYFALVYDSPLIELYTQYALSPFNYFGLFDRVQCKRMEEYGLHNVYYVPLCADVRVFGFTNITEQDEKSYAADVSFVGRLYDSIGYVNLFDEGKKALKEEFDRVVEECQCQWGEEITIYDKVSNSLIDYIATKVEKEIWENYKIEKRFYVESVKIAARCNEMERVNILNMLARKFRVTLYSDDTPKEALINVETKPWVDYVGEMPKVFYLSKINLNISSHSIESGIPQRVWDIMAVGGFCLTNYQPEIEDFFVIGEDLEVYHNLDELQEKVGYYLEHEQERIRIAMNGYKKVRSMHTYEHRLEKVMEEIFGE